MPVREGYAPLAAAGGLAVVLLAAGFVLGGWGWAVAALGLVLLGVVVWFFRGMPRGPGARRPPAGRAAEGEGV